MADRYWVGGTGTWNTTSTTNWSATSGGSGGASVPTAADNVIFDQASTYTVTMTGALTCLSFTVSAGSVTFATGTTPTLAISGSISLAVGTTAWNSTGAITFNATNSQTLDTNSIEIKSTSVTFDGVGGTWTLLSDFDVVNNSTTTLTNGTIALGSYILFTGAFYSNNTNVRTIDFGTGFIYLVGNTTRFIWDTATLTNLTISGTPLVQSAGAGTGITKSIAVGALTEANAISFSFLEASGAVTYNFNGGDNFKNLTFNGVQTISNQSINIFGSFTHQTTGGTTTFTGGPGTWTFKATSGTNNINSINGFTYNFPWTFDGVGGTWVLQNNLTLGSTRTLTLTNGTLDINAYTIAGASGLTMNTTNNFTLNSTAGIGTITMPFTHTSGSLTLGGGNININNASGYTFTAGTLSLGSNRLFTRTFSSSNSNTRTIDFGTGNITLNQAATSSTTIWNTSIPTGLTISGTPLVITSTGGGAVTKTIITGGLSEANSISFQLNDTSGTMAFSGGSVVRDLTVNGTFTYSNIAITIFGNYTQVSNVGHVQTGGTNALTFAATSGTKTISTQNTQDFPLIINGIGGTFRLISSLGVGVTRSLTLVNGTFDQNGQTLIGGVPIIVAGGSVVLRNIADNITQNSGTATLDNNTSIGAYTLNGGTLSLSSYTLTCINFNSSGSTARTLDFGTGKIVLSTTATTTVWNTGTVTNLTITGTNPLVECIGGGTAVTKTINTGALSEANSINFSFLETTGTVTYTFTAGNSFKNLIFNGVQTISNIAVNIFGTFTHQTAGGTTTFTAGTNAWTFAATSGSYNINNIAGFTYDFPWTFGSSATAQSTATWTLVNNLTLGATRQLTLANGITDFNNKTLSAAGITINGSTRTATLINTGGGGSFTTSLLITHTSGGLTLGVNVNATNASGYTLTAGTLSLDTYTLTIPSFASSNSNVRGINFGTGKIVISRSTAATIWNTGTVTSFTTSGTPLVECIGGGTAVTKTINTGALSEANSISFSFLETTGSVTYTFTASNSFRNLIFNGVQTITNIAITIFGSFTHQTTNGTTTFGAGTNAWTFNASSGSYNINNIAGFTYDFPWIFGSSAAAGDSAAVWTLVNNLTLGATRQLTLATGTLDFNNKTLSAQGITIAGVSRSSAIASTGSSVFTTSLPITHTSGNLILTVNLTTTNASGYTLTAGTLILDTFTLTTTLFSSSSTNTRSINFGTGKIVLNGGSGVTIWNTTTITNFTTSGTQLVECVSSGAGTRTISAGALSEANSISFSLLGASGVTFTFAASNTIRNLIVNGTQTISNIAIVIFGSFTHQTTNGTTTFTAGTNAWTFAATSGSRTIDNISGFTYDFPWTFGSAASTATWTLANDLTLGATRQLTLVTGALDFNNKTLVTASLFQISAGSTGVTAPRILNTGGGGSISFTQSIQKTASGSLTLELNLTTTNASGFTLTQGTLNLDVYTLTTTVFTSGGSLTRTLNYGTGQLALTGNNNTIFFVEGGAGFTTAGTVYINSTYTGATGTRILNTSFTEAQAAGYDVKTSGTSGVVIGTTATDIIALAGNWNNFDLTGLTNTLDNNTRTIYGNFTIPGSGGTINSGVNTTTFAGSGTELITTNGRTLDFPITINSTGTTRLNDALTLGSIRTLTLFGGTLDLNNLTISTGNFDSNSATTRSILFGTSGQIAIMGNNATVFNMNGASNFSWTGTPYFNCTYTGAVGTRTFLIGSGTQGVFLITNSLDVSVSGSSGIVLGSGTDTISLSGFINDLNLTGMGFTLANATRTIHGNLTIPASGGALTAGTLITTLAANGTKTIDVNRSFTSPVIIGTTSSSVSKLLSNFTLTGDVNYYLQLNAGTFDLNNFTATIPSFSSSNSSTRSIAFGTTGQLNLANSGQRIWDTTNGTNFSWTGTPRIFASNAATTSTRELVFGTIAEAFTFNIKFAGTAQANAFTINNSTDILTIFGNINDFDFTGSTNVLSDQPRTIYGNFTVPSSGGTFNTAAQVTTFAGSSGTRIITTNGRSLPIPFTFNGAGRTFQIAGATTLTQALTLTAGTLDLNNLIFTALSFTSTGTGVRSISFGTTGQITVTNSNGVTVLNFSDGTNFTWTGTHRIYASFNSSATNTRIFNFGTIAEAFTFNIKFNATPQANAVTINISTDPISIDGNINDFDFTGSTNTLGGTARNIYGNFIIPSTGGTISSTTTATTFLGSIGTRTITTNGRSLPIPLTFNGAGRTWQQTDATTSTQALTLTAGTLDLNNLTYTATVFASSSTSVRSISFGISGQISLTASATTIIDISTGTNFAWTGTPRIVSTFASTSVTARTFNIGNTAAIASAFAFDVIIGSGTGINLNASATDPLNLTGIFNNVDLRGMLNTLNNTARSIAGSFRISPTGGTFNGGTSVTTFIGNTSPYTIDTATRVLDFPFTFDGTSTWTIANTFTSGSSATVSTRALTLTRGNVSFNGVQVNCGQFSSSGTNARNLDFGANGRILLLNSATTIWDTTTGTNFTWTGNFDVDSNFIGSAGTRIINFGTLAEQYAPNVKVATAGAGFGLNTGTDSVALSGNTGSLNLTNFAGTLTNAARNVHGDLTFPVSGGIFTPGTAVTTLAATSGTEIITYNGRTIQFPLTINGTGGTFVANGNILMSTANTLTLTNGHFNANLANIVASTITISTGNAAVSNLSTTLTVTHTSGNLNLNSNISTRIYTLSAGNVNLDIHTLNCTSFTSTTTTTRAINFGTGNILISNTVGGIIWNTSSVTNLSTSGSGAVIISNSGSTASTISPGSLSESNSINFIFNTGTYAATITAGSVKNLNFTGFSGSLLNTVTTVYGDLTISTGMTLTAGASAVTFANTSSQNITSNGKTFDFPITFNGVTGTVNLLDNLTIGSTRTTTLTSGALNLNNYNFSTGLFSSSNSNSRSIDFANTGKIILTASTAVTYWNTGTITGFFYSGNSNIETAGSGAVTKTINTGSPTELQALNFNIKDTAGTVAFTSANRVKNLTLNGSFTLSNIPITIFGDYVYTAATALTAGTNAWTFDGSTTSYINGGGVTHDFPWTIIKDTDLILQGTTTIGSTRTTSYKKGTFDLNGYNYTTGLFDIGYSGDSSISSSVYFDGNGGYLSTSSSSLIIGTDSFTIECWVYPITGGNTNGGVISSTNPQGTDGIGLAIDKGFIKTSVYPYPDIEYDWSSYVNLNQWNHLAMTRQGTTVRWFVNGALLNTSTTGESIDADGYVIGRRHFLSNIGHNYLTGYVSNARIIKGTALYTSSFTPPTLPLTAITGTQLLTCQNIIVDRSLNNLSIQTFGNTNTSNVTPFLYHSAYFDGNNNFLSVPDNIALRIMSSNYTVEAWIYPEGTPDPSYGYAIITNSTTGSNGWLLRLKNNFQFALVYPGDAAYDFGPTISTSSWTHVAIVKTGSSVVGYVNGIQYSIVNNSPSETNGTWRIGREATTTVSSFAGYISNVRIVKGTAVYTSNFAHSTFPLTPIANTSLLTCQNTYFKDNSNNNFTVNTTGNITAVTKNPFLNSVYFDGNGDYLTVPANTAFDFGTDNFTVECWFNIAGNSTVNPDGNRDATLIGSFFDSGTSTGWAVTIQGNPSTTGTSLSFVAWNSGVLTVFVPTMTTLSKNTWYHAAVVRTGDSLKIFLDGVDIGSTSWTVPVVPFGQIRIGALQLGTAPKYYNYFNGYISNLRVLKGTSLYGSNFTPSLIPLTAVANTSLLTCTGGNFEDFSNNIFTITNNGNAAVVDSNPFVIETVALDKTLQFSNGGTITITGSGSNTFNNQVTEGIDIEVSNGNAVISMTSSSSKMFNGNNISYSPIILNQGGTGQLFVRGNNAFGDISASITATSNATILLEANTTTTFNTFTLSGNTVSLRYPTLNSNTEGFKANVASNTSSNGIYNTGADYIFCRNIGFVPYNSDGSDYVRWFVGANSISLNNNAGAFFQNYDANNFDKVYIIEANTTWTVPEDFNVSNNTIHLFGAGGGGGVAGFGGASQGGGGGGGGGYTRVSNAYFYGNQTIFFEIGTGGSGVTSSNGGPTKLQTWYGIYTANGGNGAGNGSANTISGGTGGVGATATGGTGGRSQYSTGSLISAGGGGGGGAGGPLGSGGNGGNASRDAGNESTAGGGGGGNGGGGPGTSAAGATGGSGGNNAIGFGRGVGAAGDGTLSFAGGGAAGASSSGSNRAGVGSTGIEILNSFGSGGGAGGGTGQVGGNLRQLGGLGGKFGGGGGGGGCRSLSASNGGNGGSGGAIIVYKPDTAPKTNFILMF